MRKLLLFSVLSLLIGKINAQISVESFTLLESDLDARNYPILDDEGSACALVKIVTTAKGFNFEIGQLPVKKVDESKVGEIWVYVPDGTMKMKLSHADLGSLRGADVENGYYMFSQRLKKAKVYRMVLTHKEVYKFVEGTGETVTITFQSEVEGAEVWIGNNLAGTIQNGKFKITWPQKLICEYKIHKDNYEDVVGKISNTEKDVNQIVNPLPYFGILKISTSEKAEICINNSLEGKGHVVKELMPGKYFITITEKDKKTISKNIIIQRGKTEYIYDRPEKIYSQVKLYSNPEGCSIMVDGRNVGETPKSISLEAGDHVFKMSKFGYKNKTVSKHINPNTVETISMSLFKPSLYKKNMFYTGLGYQVLGSPKMDVKIGGYINWVNLELSFNILGSCEAKWYDGNTLVGTDYYDDGFGIQGKIGYGFVVGSRLLITPQVGYAFGGYSCKSSDTIDVYLGSGANQALTITCKLDYSPSKHITLYTSPMYSLRFATPDDEYTYKSSVLDQTFNGFSIAIGASVYF